MPPLLKIIKVVLAFVIENFINLIVHATIATQPTKE